jgi:hypothetical protein
MLARMPVALRRLPISLLVLGACADAVHGGAHYSYVEPEPPAQPPGALLSAHLGRFGETPEPTRARVLEGDEATHDRLTLVFNVELDPLTIEPLAFGVLRGDGRRVRPVRVFLAPADEADENRSLTLIGNFGEPGTPPVAVHVIGSLYAESGADLRGLDADIIGPDEPDRPVFAERLDPDASRCPGAQQLVRTYWTDSLRSVGADDLAGVSLSLGDGRSLTPLEFDDHATRTDDPACASGQDCAGPTDDNVLDLCVDSDVAVVRVRFAAGLFTDTLGHPTAAADVSVEQPSPQPVAKRP